MSLKINQNRIGFELCIIGAFLLTYYLRSVFVPENFVAVNVLSCIGLILVLIKYGKQYFSSFEKKYVLMSMTILSAVFVVSEYKNHYSIMYGAKCWLTLIPPIFLVFVDLNKKEFEKIFLFFIKCLDILTYIMFLVLILDLISGSSVMIWFSQMAHNHELYVLSKNSVRYCSIIGHYIPTAQIYLVFYIFHMISQRLGIKKINVFFVTVVALIGVGMTASKANIAALVIAIFLFNMKSLKKILGCFALFMIAYGAGVFDKVIYRLLTTDLTTGRASAWFYVVQNVSDLFPIVYGHGTSSVFNLNKTSGIRWASSAFEYPYRSFCYEMGVIFTVIFMIVIIIIPVKRVIKNKGWHLSIFFALVIFVINLYNGISIYMDFFLQYCIYAFMFIQLSEHYETNVLLRIKIGSGKN